DLRAAMIYLWMTAASPDHPWSPREWLRPGSVLRSGRGPVDELLQDLVTEPRGKVAQVGHGGEGTRGRGARRPPRGMTSPPSPIIAGRPPSCSPRIVGNARGAFDR